MARPAPRVLAALLSVALASTLAGCDAFSDDPGEAVPSLSPSPIEPADPE